MIVVCPLQLWLVLRLLREVNGFHFKCKLIYYKLLC